MPGAAEGSADRPRAVVLLSGGMDSATLLALAARDGFQCHALSVDYGQRNRAELEAAGLQAAKAAEHRVLRLDLAQFGGSSLTDSSRSVPETVADGGIPDTYVPARNTVFLSVALAWAETLPANDLFIGANAVDYSGYPDCRPEYIAAFEKMARLATLNDKVNIRAPLIDKSKAEIVGLGLELGVDYAQTVSCYQPDGRGRACGRCPACRLRLAGFADAGHGDPAIYV